MSLNVTLLTFTAAALFAGGAQGAIVASTFGPGDSFDTVSGLTLGSGLRGGVTFTPGTSATLDTIRLGASHIMFSGPNDFYAYIAPDNVGVPGAALETFAGIALPPNNSGGIHTLNSVLHPLLEAGTTYWLVLSPFDINGTMGIWQWNDQGIALGAYYNYNDAAAWTPYTIIDGFTPAYEIAGTLQSPVPEPGTLLLSFAGLAAARLVRRRS